MGTGQMPSARQHQFGHLHIDHRHDWGKGLLIAAFTPFHRERLQGSLQHSLDVKMVRATGT